MADANFEKHVYGRERKRSMEPIEDFDPRPPESIGTVIGRLTDLLAKVQGKGFGVSSLLYPKMCVWNEGSTSSCAVSDGPPCLPFQEELICRVSALKDSLKLSTQKICDIERKTKDQDQSPLWHSRRRFWLTASYFGEIRRRLSSTSLPWCIN